MKMASLCAASFGDSSASIFWNVSLVFDPDLGDPRQQRTRLLHRLDRVGECRRRFLVGDDLHLGELLLHARFDGRLVVGGLDLVEGRRVERQRAGLEKRIRAGRGGCLSVHCEGSQDDGCREQTHTHRFHDGAQHGRRAASSRSGNQ
jgi:hypothetical protein